MPLFPAQQEALRKLVEAAEKTQSAEFHLHTSFDDDTVNFPGLTMLSLGRGMATALIGAGFVIPITRGSARLSDAAFDVVQRNFAPPASPAPPAATHVTTNNITVNGPMSGNIVQGETVDVSVTGVEAEKFLSAVRAAAGGNADVLEQMDYIAEELNTGSPKPRKLQAFIGAAMTFARDNAALANALVNLAKFLGLDPSNSK